MIRALQPSASSATFFFSFSILRLESLSRTASKVQPSWMISSLLCRAPSYSDHFIYISFNNVLEFDNITAQSIHFTVGIVYFDQVINFDFYFILFFRDVVISLSFLSFIQEG